MAPGRRLGVSPPGPVPLRPLPDRAGACPAGHGSLAAQGVHVAGWRTLLRGRCPECGHTFLQDLPTGHGLIYPASLDLDSGQVHAEPATPWFSERLRGFYERPDADPVRVSAPAPVSPGPAVLLNCLDVVYGHSLLKLLNAGRHRHEYCVAIVPEALAELVPAHVDEAWVVHAGFGRLGRWLLELEAWVDERLNAFEEGVTLSPAYPHPHPSTYDVAELGSHVEGTRRGDPSLVLALREDRIWGRTARAQARNVVRLVERVRRTYPQAGFTAVGIGAAGGLPDAVDDQRVPAPDADRERRWLAAMRGADLAVGVHGSNLLLPSGLAGATIELVPRERYANFLQATLVSERDPLTALMAHRAFYGDAHLADVDGAAVGALAANLLAELPRFRTVMAGELAGVAPDDLPPADALTPAPPDVDLAPGLLARAAPPVRQAANRARGMAGTARLLAGRGAAGARARRRSLPAVMTDSRGARLELVDHAEVAAFLEHSGHFEGAEIDLLARFLRPGDTALDVGANIGHFTAAMGRAVGGQGTLHAFEPLESNRRRLARTIALNGLEGTAEVVPAAVGAKQGTIAITDYGEGYGSWATTRPREQDPRGGQGAPAVQTEVPVVTLDAHCAQRGIEHVAAAKIDVEGAELDVLEGAQGLLAADAFGLLLVEVSDNTTPAGRRAWELVEALSAPPLRTYVLRHGRLEPFRAAGRLDFAGVVSLSPAGRARLGL